MYTSGINSSVRTGRKPCKYVISQRHWVNGGASKAS